MKLIENIRKNTILLLLITMVVMYFILKDNLQNIDKLRPTISRYDLCLLLFEFAQFVCDNQKLFPDRNEIQNMVRKMQIIIHQNKFENLKLNIVDIFDELTKEGKYHLIKKFILNTNKDISKFK